jgi:hypothetical protein
MLFESSAHHRFLHFIFKKSDLYKLQISSLCYSCPTPHTGLDSQYRVALHHNKNTTQSLQKIFLLNEVSAKLRASFQFQHLPHGPPSLTVKYGNL